MRGTCTPVSTTLMCLPWDGYFYWRLRTILPLSMYTSVFVFLFSVHITPPLLHSFQIITYTVGNLCYFHETENKINILALVFTISRITFTNKVSFFTMHSIIVLFHEVHINKKTSCCYVNDFFWELCSKYQRRNSLNSWILFM